MAVVETLSPPLLDLAFQSAIVFGIAFLLTRSRNPKTAAFRHAVWSGAAIVAILLPLGYAMWPRSAWLVESATQPPLEIASGSMVALGDVPATTTAAAPTSRPTAPTMAPTNVAAPGEALPSGGAPATTEAVASDPAPAMNATVLLISLWVAGALFMLARLIGGGRWVRRISRGPKASREIRALAARCAERAGLARPPRVRMSDDVDAPAVAGWLRPTLLLPTDLVRKLSPELLEPLVLHEAVHLARRDHLIGAMTHLLRAVHWYSPFAWSLVKDVSRDRELLTDARVVTLEESRSNYAEGLLRVVEGGDRRLPPVAAAVGIGAGNDASLRQRLELVLRDAGPRTLSRAARSVILVGAVALGAIVMSAGVAAPEPRFEDDRSAATADAAEPVLIVVDATSPPTAFRVEGLALTPRSLREYLARYTVAADAAYGDVRGRTTTHVIVRSPASAAVGGLKEALRACAAVGIDRVDVVIAGRPETRRRLNVPRDRGLDAKPRRDEVRLRLSIEAGADGRPRYRLGASAVATAPGDPTTALHRALKAARLGGSWSMLVIHVSDEAGFASAHAAVSAARLAGIDEVAFSSSSAPPAEETEEVEEPGDIEEEIPEEKPVPLGQIDEAIDKALAWLVRRQAEDGGWHDPGLADKGGLDAGRSGLATLALLAGPSTARRTRAIDRGVKWIVQQQDLEGCLGPRVPHSFMYNHGAASLALQEAYAATKSELLRAPSRRAVGFTLQAKNPYKAWRYNPRSGDNDTSVTVWQVMSLAAARAAGQEVPDAAFRDALGWVEEMTDEDSGRVGYTKRGEPPVRKVGTQERFPSNMSEAITGAGLTIRLLCGEGPKTKAFRQGTELLARRLPRWGAGGTDLYHWYFGTVALSRSGSEVWPEWGRALIATVLPEQNGDGSWSPESAWGSVGGRIYSTAMIALTLEICRRNL